MILDWVFVCIHLILPTPWNSIIEDMPCFLVYAAGTVVLNTKLVITDYRRPERKQPSLYGRKFNLNPKFLGMDEEYFVCHIGPIFQISLIYAIIGSPQSVQQSKQQTQRAYCSNIYTVDITLQNLDSSHIAISFFQIDK